jgi:sugar phosphate isomerase/epimerase
MEIGLSTACFYPQETEKALLRVANLGFNTVEIFLNAFCETNGRVFDEILKTVKSYNLNIVSVHPFTSFAEGFLLFSKYSRRYADGLELYKRFFEFCAKLGSKILVLHGVHSPSPWIFDEQYYERFCEIADCSKSFGVRLTQENVVDFKSASPGFLKGLADYAGELFSLTLDVKQARRSGVCPFELAKTFGKSIEHVHLSDCNEKSDCIAPGEGTFDFARFFSLLKDEGFKGEAIIELYSSGFENDEQLAKAKTFLTAAAAKTS